MRRRRRARTGRVRGRRDAGRPRPGRDAKERGAPVAARGCMMLRPHDRYSPAPYLSANYGRYR
ncbi:hypothetical protein BURPS668_1365 [Burkholderia pseudomallei 668]|nr:hypothetical protein BURPS668_1365 [Burkholderia pseudomallei 668]